VLHFSTAPPPAALFNRRLQIKGEVAKMGDDD